MVLTPPRSILRWTLKHQASVVEGKDIRFTRISSSQGLSQVRVSDIVQTTRGLFGLEHGTAKSL